MSPTAIKNLSLNANHGSKYIVSAIPSKAVMPSGKSVGVSCVSDGAFRKSSEQEHKTNNVNSEPNRYLFIIRFILCVLKFEYS
ncbi:hypothetical protein GCM10027429_23480 [Marivirga atlantica]